MFSRVIVLNSERRNVEVQHSTFLGYQENIHGLISHAVSIAKFIVDVGPFIGEITNNKLGSFYFERWRTQHPAASVTLLDDLFDLGTRSTELKHRRGRRAEA